MKRNGGRNLKIYGPKKWPKITDIFLKQIQSKVVM